MKYIIYIAVLLQVGWSYGESHGVGSYSYSDSSGRRYGGTYGLKDGQIVDAKGSFPPDFKPPAFPNVNDFFPEYLKNLESLLHDAVVTYDSDSPSSEERSFEPFKPFTPFKPLTFPKMQFPKMHFPKMHFPKMHFPKMHFPRTFQSSLEHQRQALDAARKAFDLTSNQAGAGFGHNSNPGHARPGYTPFRDFTDLGDFPAVPDVPRFPDLQFPPFRSFETPDFDGDSNSAAAAAVFAPGYEFQMAAISPPNPNNPNVNVEQISTSGGGPGYHQVVASSYSSSYDVNGVKTNNRGASTIIDDNGKVTRYDVTS